MKLFLKVSVVLVALWLSTVPLSAVQILLDDNFNSENGGVGKVNYTAFANWTVSDGTVDLIGNGFYDFLPGNGLYLDMDGSTRNAGKITTKTSFDFIPGATYTLQFDLAGANAGPDDQLNSVIVQVQLGNILNETIELPKTALFSTYTRTFTVGAATSGRLSFDGVGGDNIGLLLDDVRLSVPDGASTLLLLGMALTSAAIIRRR